MAVSTASLKLDEILKNRGMKKILIHAKSLDSITQVSIHAMPVILQ